MNLEYFIWYDLKCRRGCCQASWCWLIEKRWCMPQQLPLHLTLDERNTFYNFVAGDNEQLVACLEQIARGRGEQFVYLFGQTQVGKTHLLQACCHKAHHLQLSPIYLPLKDIDSLSPQMLDNLTTLPLVFVDDVDAIVGRPDWEEAFFHFYNQMQQVGRRLIVTAKAPPRDLGLALNDLVSRLNWGISYQVKPLSDTEKIQLLMTRAHQQGLHMPQNVAEYLMKVHSRDVGQLLQTFDTLQQATLQYQHKLTIPFVKKVLNA